MPKAEDSKHFAFCFKLSALSLRLNFVFRFKLLALSFKLFCDVFCTADVHVLFDRGHRGEADIPAADADLEAAVLFWLALGGLQRFSVEDVEMDG